ncbi:hypothetical protein [Lysinibacillus sphaericus]|uniref:hypothetical protein n=1 Tax=Lysinibacillus sphaericus TaxID=1421 RepID=UPI0011C07DE1|nr:hypothetical protein [Lysinibacillus sphaericus]
MAQQGNFSLMVAPIEFTVKAVSTIKTVDITSFNAYVQRTITIPKDVEASKLQRLSSLNKTAQHNMYRQK